MYVWLWLGWCWFGGGAAEAVWNVASIFVLLGLVVVRVVIIAGHEGPSGRTSQADHIGQVHPDISEIPFKKTYRDFV